MMNVSKLWSNFQMLTNDVFIRSILTGTYIFPKADRQVIFNVN